MISVQSGIDGCILCMDPTLNNLGYLGKPQKESYIYILMDKCYDTFKDNMIDLLKYVFQKGTESSQQCENSKLLVPY